MFVVVHRVTITQVSTTQYPNRTRSFLFDFITSNSGSSSWANLTDTFTITLPRRIYFKDNSTGKTTTWDDTPVYGNPDTQPLLLRGDKILIEQGYSYFKPTSQGGFNRRETVTDLVTRFDGYITRIVNKTPITLECKDNMFLLQQSYVEDKLWDVNGTTYTLETMLKEMLLKSPIAKVKTFGIKIDNFKHNIGKFRTEGVTIAQVLQELRQYYHLESYFRGDELRCGVIRYYPEDKKSHTFHFQKNVIDDDLDYQRKDDIRIGILAKSINKVEVVGATNSKGKAKTKHVELKVNVGDQDGEIRTMFFWGVESTAQLKKLAEKKLPFIKYEGFRGSFTTFSLPKVKHGDEVVLIDDVVKEMSGTYLVKDVKDESSPEGGLRQRIYIDIRIDGIGDGDLVEYQNNGI